MRLAENFSAADKIHKRIPTFLVETTRKISKKNKPPGAQQRSGGLTNGRASVRMFHDGVQQKAVERVCDIPIQNFTHKFSIVADHIKVVGILLQNLRLRKGLPLLMKRKTDGIKCHCLLV